MATIRDLIKGTQKVAPKTLDRAPDGKNSPLIKEDGSKSAIEMVVFKGMKSVVFRTKQRASGRWPRGNRPTSRNGVYKQVMRFTFKSDDDIRKKKKPGSAKEKVNVNCGCDDYYFKYWWWNKKVKAHEGGNYAKYQRVTPDSGRPEVNPDHIPGVCKHLLFLYRELKRKKKVN